MATNFYPLTIKSIEKLTDDSISITLEIPEALKKQFSFIPGQYLTFRTLMDGQELRRSYSICSPDYDDCLSIAVKRMEGGKFSNYANDVFKPGAVLDTMPPMGNFVSKKTGAKKHYLFIAAGSGITPMMSLIASILKSEPDSMTTLIFGNKSRASIMFKEKLEALKNTYMSRLSIFHVFSREMADTELFNGRITREKMSLFGKHLLDYKSLDEVFICGPEEMIIDLKDYLVQDEKIDSVNIHLELFTSPDTPKSTSEAWKKKLETVDKNQMSQVTVKLDGVSFDVQLNYGGDSILDAALKRGADLPYACKGGVCATCKAKLVEGEVEMETNYSLEKDELERGFILTCQSHPRSEIVKVDFDQK